MINLGMWIKWVTATLTVIGMLWGGMVTLDDRYARSEAVQRQVDSLTALYLQQQVTALEREDFELTRESHKRKLSDFEQERQDAVRKQLQMMKGKLKEVMP